MASDDRIFPAMIDFLLQIAARQMAVEAIMRGQNVPAEIFLAALKQAEEKIHALHLVTDFEATRDPSHAARLLRDLQANL